VSRAESANKLPRLCLIRAGCDGELGPVDIHFSQIMAATRNSTDANDKMVFS
jgi:hypothetical protein